MYMNVYTYFNDSDVVGVFQCISMCIHTLMTVTLLVCFDVFECVYLL